MIQIQFTMTHPKELKKAIFYIMDLQEKESVAIERKRNDCYRGMAFKIEKGVWEFVERTILAVDLMNDTRYDITNEYDRAFEFASKKI